MATKCTNLKAIHCIYWLITAKMFTNFSKKLLQLRRRSLFKKPKFDFHLPQQTRENLILIVVHFI